MTTRDQIISAELDDDPLSRNYAAMTDQQAADDMNTNMVTVANDVSVAELEKAIRESLKWVQYREAADLQSLAGVYDNPAMREFMDIFLSSLAAAGGTLNMRADYMDGLVDRMIAEGSMGGAAGLLLKQFGDVQISRAEEIGAPNVLAGEVERARS